MTAERDADLERWDAVMDALALGEPVSPADLELAREYGRRYPECAVEERLVAELPLLGSRVTSAAQDASIIEQVFEGLEGRATSGSEAQPRRSIARAVVPPIAIVLVLAGAALVAARVLDSQSRPAVTSPQAPSDPIDRVALRVVRGELLVGGQRLEAGSEAPFDETLQCVAIRTCLEDRAVELCCDRDTRIRLIPREALGIALERGRIQVAAHPDNRSAPIAVETPGGRISTTTGLFRVEMVSADGGFELETLVGPVTVATPDLTTRELASGDRFVTRPGS